MDVADLISRNQTPDVSALSTTCSTSRCSLVSSPSLSSSIFRNPLVRERRPTLALEQLHAVRVDQVVDNRRQVVELVAERVFQLFIGDTAASPEAWSSFNICSSRALTSAMVLWASRRLAARQRTACAPRCSLQLTPRRRWLWWNAGRSQRGSLGAAGPELSIRVLMRQQTALAASQPPCSHGNPRLVSGSKTLAIRLDTAPNGRTARRRLALDGHGRKTEAQ